MHRDARDDATTIVQPSIPKHGVGHSATFSERVQFPAELGEFFFVYFLLPMRVCAYIQTPALIFDSRGDERARTRRVTGEFRERMKRDCYIAALARLHDSRFSSSRLESDQLLYLIWRCSDSRAGMGIGRIPSFPVYVFCMYARRSLACREAREHRERHAIASPARKARRNKETRSVNKRNVGREVRSEFRGSPRDTIASVPEKIVLYDFFVASRLYCFRFPFTRSSLMSSLT